MLPESDVPPKPVAGAPLGLADGDELGYAPAGLLGAAVLAAADGLLVAGLLVTAGTTGRLGAVTAGLLPRPVPMPVPVPIPVPLLAAAEGLLLVAGATAELGLALLTAADELAGAALESLAEAAGAALDGFAGAAVDGSAEGESFDDFAEDEADAVAVAGVTTAGAVTGGTTGGFAVGAVELSPALMPISVNTVARTAIATTAPTTQAVLLGWSPLGAPPSDASGSWAMSTPDEQSREVN